MPYDYEKQRAYRERKKAEKAAAAAAVAAGEPIIEESDAPAVLVDVPDGVTAAAAVKPSLKDRLLGLTRPGGQAAEKPAAKARGRATKKESAISQVLGMTVTGLLVQYSNHLLPEEYKACAPTMEEASAIIGPLFSIMGRMVEVTGKVSQTTIDLANSLLAGLVYGMRAHITYLMIKKDKQHGNASSNASSNATTGRNYQVADIRPDGYISFGTETAEYTIPDKNDVIRRGAAAETLDTERITAEADAVSELLSRDRSGRVRLGLLPGGL